jgi:outer membrane protein assembly factor BamB
MRPRRLTLALSLVLAVVSALHAANWPRFRGPNGAGVADDKDIPVRWTDKDGLLWKVAIPGEGHSSPVVWDDKVFLQSAAPDGKERWLLCLDAGSGKLLWQEKVPASSSRINPLNTLASSTPATEGERVYVVFWDGKEIELFAYDFKGKLQWKRDLGGFKSQHGAGTSPIVYNGVVYLNNDQDGSAAVLALDAKTGRDLWKAERKAFRTCYSVPFVHEKKDGAELIVASTAGITSYNPASGDVNWNFVWKFTGMALRTVSSPISGNGLVFATSGDGSGARATIAVKVGGKGDVTATNLAWERRDEFNLPYVPCLLAYGDYVFSVTDLDRGKRKRGMAACYQAKTGEEVWSEELGASFTASPILIDGKIYAVNDKGEVYVFEAGSKYKLLAKNPIGEPVSASPAVADGRLFIRGKEHLFCIGKAE